MYNYNNVYKKHYKVTKNIKTKKFYFNINFYLTPNNKFQKKQQKISFFKKKFGLFKNTNFFEKRIKNDIFSALNFIKYNEVDYKKKYIKKKYRVFFAKKFNKLFFRAGRKILLNKINLKKHLIQKYISKKINHFIKKPDISFIKNISSNTLLIKCGIFYTLNDANNFIKIFGIVINNNTNYNTTEFLKPNDCFSIIWVKYLFKYLKKKKKTIIFNLKKLKIYRFRIKEYSKKKNEWIPITAWLLDYSCLYIPKHPNIEFDIKTLSGFLLYNYDLMTTTHYFNNTNISLYMTRSYNWKYIV